MIYDAIGRCIFSLGLVLVGAAAWITMERTHVVKPMCTVDTSLWADARQSP